MVGALESVLATDWSITWAELARIVVDLTPRLAFSIEFPPRLKFNSIELEETKEEDRSETELGGFWTRRKKSAEQSGLGSEELAVGLEETEMENGFAAEAMGLVSGSRSCSG